MEKGTFQKYSFSEIIRITRRGMYLIFFLFTFSAISLSRSFLRHYVLSLFHCDIFSSCILISAIIFLLVVPQQGFLNPLVISNPLMKYPVTFKRLMSTLAELPKTSTFTGLDPDGRISSKEIAITNEKNVIHTPRIVSEGAFSWTLPEKRKEYEHLISSEAAFEDLGLDPSQVNDSTYQLIVSGEFYHKESFESQGFPFPYSQAYAGWQFGQFAGQLGDGRALSLFEVPKIKKTKENRGLYEIQLKGAGLTPYSRFADGKAVLRSSIREYIISEHLHAIGIPTTRALALTYLPKTVARRSGWEKCAIVSRFAELWIRLGTFDLYRWRGDRLGIKKLADYVIDELFTIEGEKFGHLNKILSLNPKLTSGELTIYDKMYYESVVRNASTTAMWQAYGFLNGVLNTDNTSVLGLSMDFGPFSIMDKYDPNYTPNSEDHEHRYGYSNTPTAIWWNLTRFGEDLAELIGSGPEYIDQFETLKIDSVLEEKIITRATKIIEDGAEIYQYAFTKTYVETFLNRLGLSHKLVEYENIDLINKELVAPLLEVLLKIKVDYNKFFLNLQESSLEDDGLAEKILSLNLDFDELVSRYSSVELLDEINKWLATYRRFILESVKFDPVVGKEISSLHNPQFLPRNWILDQVIDFTTESNGEDLSYLEKLQKMSLNPYDSSKWGEELKDVEKEWLLQGDMGDKYSMLQCSCSS